MLPQPTPATLRRLSSRLPKGKRWPYFYPLNVAALPVRPLKQALYCLPWSDLGWLSLLLQGLGNLGDTTVNELMLAIERHLGRRTEVDHERMKRCIELVDRMTPAQLEEALTQLEADQAEMGAA